jgi:hypothetical protein
MAARKNRPVNDDFIDIGLFESPNVNNKNISGIMGIGAVRFMKNDTL